MGLLKKNTITIATRQGECEIQLLCGDICHLSVEDKMDIVMTSAFPGSYTVATGKTLISSLKSTLGISVAKLAYEKEFDLRTHFSCWVSKPLPSDMPFRRLVCFETSVPFKSVHASEEISLVFRAMMPIFNNQDTTVITPLLATGSQGKSRTVILRAMVDAACHWIQAGLPLRCMKIVLYAEDPAKLLERDIKVINLFQTLKVKWERLNNKKVDAEKKQHDVYISYSSEDDHWVNDICAGLIEAQKDLKIFRKHLSFHEEDVWQQDIFDVMIHSKRIIAVLTPAYVNNKECLEQFNMALCCNRLQGKELLYPFYVETVQSFPTYMLLVQYVECRARKEGEISQKKIKAACKGVIGQPRRDEVNDSSGGAITGMEDQSPPPVHQTTYDIFISYSHQCPAEAEMLQKLLGKRDPTLSVFFDRSELRTGSIWQQSLYNAVDGARCVVTLISEPYLQSAVCQEEYNIAVGRFLAGENMQFLPICVSDIKSIPSSFGVVKMVDCRGDQQLIIFEKIVDGIIRWVKDEEPNDVFVKVPVLVNSIKVMEEKRRLEMDNFIFEKGTLVRKLSSPDTSSNPEDNVEAGCDVGFSFSQDSFVFAAIVSAILTKKLPHLNCRFVSGQKDDRLQMLDSAEIVIIFVSEQYTQSSQLMEELHLSLCRQRAEKNRDTVYLVQTQILSSGPFYLSLLPYKTSLQDQIWKDFAGMSQKKERNIRIFRDDIQGTFKCTMPEYFALTKVCLEAVESLNFRNILSSTANKTNIVNIMKVQSECLETEEENVQLSQCIRSPIDGIETILSESKRSSQKHSEQDGGLKAEGDELNVNEKKLYQSTKGRTDNTEPTCDDKDKQMVAEETGSKSSKSSMKKPAKEDNESNYQTGRLSHTAEVSGETSDGVHEVQKKQASRQANDSKTKSTSCTLL